MLEQIGNRATILELQTPSTATRRRKAFPTQTSSTTEPQAREGEMNTLKNALINGRIGRRFGVATESAGESLRARIASIPQPTTPMVHSRRPLCHYDPVRSTLLPLEGDAIDQLSTFMCWLTFPPPSRELGLIPPGSTSGRVPKPRSLRLGRQVNAASTAVPLFGFVHLTDCPVIRKRDATPSRHPRNRSQALLRRQYHRTLLIHGAGCNIARWHD